MYVLGLADPSGKEHSAKYKRQDQANDRKHEIQHASVAIVSIEQEKCDCTDE